MSHIQLYSAFMNIIQDEVYIHTMTNRYGYQYQLINDLINHFESAQQYRISNNQKNLVEKSNHHQISRWACAHLRVKIGHQSYAKWELQYECISRILLKTIHPVIFQEHGFPKSYLNRYLQNIYPLYQSRNLYHLQKIVEVGEISPGKTREIVNLKLQMKKNGRPTYLNENMSLVIASAKIEDGHGLPFGLSGVE